MPRSTFPPGFLWGASTSGYQIEGAAEAGGKGESIWDRFAHEGGRTLHDDNGDRACDSFDPRRLRGDLDLMADLGLKAYIFSIQWPRIQPAGKGRANPHGLDYYRRLIEGLLQRGIAPVPTLYHWELPQVLQTGGGWMRRDTALRFADYASILAQAFGKLVPLWITQNEPHTSTWLGHVTGKHAPGQVGEQHVAPVAHHLLLSHGLALQRLRDEAPGARVGIVLNVSPYRAASHSARDRAARLRLDGEQNRLFLDPLFHGRYPADVVRRLTRAGHGFDCIRDGDLQAIAAPLDFLGVNYYAPIRVTAGRGGAPEAEAPPGPKTAMDWGIDPAGLGEVLRRLVADYTGTLPLIVTENGISCRDYVDPDGACKDQERVEFLRDHIAEAERAVASGVPLLGYFVWSLLDNFEWDSGYRERFGLVHVDYPTQTRTRKSSFEWYRRVIAGRGQAPRR